MLELFHARKTLLSIALAITLASACGDPQDLDDPSELIESGDPAQNNDSTEPVRGTDGGQAILDAAVGTQDAGTSGGNSDAGSIVARSDAGSASADAGGVRTDAGSVARDAGATTDGGGGLCATLTYASFGMQFMSSYCASCHTGTGAKHGVHLDTLAGVQMSKAAVKRAAVTGITMPMATQNSQPSEADRQKLGQWLDCGPN